MDFMLDKRLAGSGGYIDFNALASVAGLPGGPAAMMNLLGNIPGMNIPGLLSGIPGMHGGSGPGSGAPVISSSGSAERNSSSSSTNGACSLPKGWSREETKRQTGLSAGRIDVYYVSPEGKKFWTKPQLAKYFGNSLDLSNFDFHSGKFHSGSSSSGQPHHQHHSNSAGQGHSLSILPHLPQSSSHSHSSHNHNNISLPPSSGSTANLAPKKVPKPQVQPPPATATSSSLEISKVIKNDNSLQSPIRQTASIFKQPVTIIKTQKSRVKTDFKHGVQEVPKQLFWEKRLGGLKPCGPSGTEYSPRDLPHRLRAVGPRIDPETVYHSISTALHLNNQPITGQAGSRSSLECNPGVYVNPEQPLIREVSIDDEDIRAQEEMVLNARKQLELALQSFYPTLPKCNNSLPSTVIPGSGNDKTVNIKPSRPSTGSTNFSPGSSNPHKKLRTGTSSHHNSLFASIKS